MNEAYLNKEEIIITKIDGGWYDQENSIVFIKSIRPNKKNKNNEDNTFSNYYVKLKHRGKLCLGVKYIVHSILGDIKIEDEIFLSFRGESVTNFLGPRDIIFSKNPSEKIWDNYSPKKYSYDGLIIEMNFNKGTGWTRQNIIDKNGETKHYWISLRIKGVKTINQILLLAKMHHDFLFGFNWLENEEIKVGKLHFNQILFNKKITIKDSMLNKLKWIILGDAKFYKDSNIELFLQTFNFIDLLRKNNKLEIRTSILSTISEILFDKFYITKFPSNNKAVKNLTNKLKLMLPIWESTKLTGKEEKYVEYFKNARNSISHSKFNNNYNAEGVVNISNKIIWIWSYFINSNYPKKAMINFFNSDINFDNNYSAFYVTSGLLESINKYNLIKILVSTLDTFKQSVWKNIIINKMESLMLNEYIFYMPDGTIKKFKIIDEMDNQFILSFIEQEQKDFKNRNISISYNDLLNLNIAKLDNTKKLLKYIINLIKPNFRK